MSKKICKYETDILNGNYLIRTEMCEAEFAYTNENLKEPIISINVYPNTEMQTWIGMGGAITEASSYNMDKLSNEDKQKFIEAYYGSSGLEYNLARISIASNDFSLKKY